MTGLCAGIVLWICLAIAWFLWVNVHPFLGGLAVVGALVACVYAAVTTWRESVPPPAGWPPHMPWDGDAPAAQGYRQTDWTR